MGFQSSFNQLLSMATIGIGAAKHTGEQAKANKLTALNREEEISEKEIKTREESTNLDNELDKTLKEVTDLTKNPDAYKSIVGEDAYNKALEDLTAKSDMLENQIMAYNERKKFLEKRKELYAEMGGKK